MGISGTMFSRPVQMVMTVVIGMIGMTMLGKPLANGIVLLKAGGIGNAAVPLLELIPFAILIGTVFYLFKTSLGESVSGEEGTATLVRILVVVVAGVMIGVMVTSLVGVNTEYAKQICSYPIGDAVTGATTVTKLQCATGSLAEGAKFSITGPIAAVTAAAPLSYVQHYPNVSGFLEIVPLGYAVAMLNFAFPALGQKAISYGASKGVNIAPYVGGNSAMPMRRRRRTA